MLIMVDSLAERYGLLPSEVMNRADTFDLAVLTAAISYRNELQENAQNSNYIPKHQQPNQQEMMEMLSRVRQQEKTK